MDGNGYKKQIKQFGDYGSNQLQSSFSNTFKSIGKMAIAAFSIKAIADFTASCLKLGSDLTEVQNVVDVSFPSMTAQVDSFAKNAITNFGMSELAAKKFMGSFGAMSRAYGFNEAKAEEMSETLTGLVGDVSSFYNIDQEDAYAKLSAVFTSETEALKHLGVVMTQNALDEYALANGYGKTTAKMTEQEKVALRYAFVQKQLSLATGDFVRTQDSWANQTRVLTLRFESFKASLGKGFIALFSPIVKGINWVLANLQPLADSFASLMEFLTGTKVESGGGALGETAGDLSDATSGADGLSDGLDGAGKSGEKAAKKINKAFAGVDTINKLDFGGKDESGSGDGGGGTGGSVADAVDFAKPTGEASVFKGMLDGIIKEFKRLFDIFKGGFSIGLGDSFKNIEEIKKHIFSIGETIVEIFTDSKVISAGKKWLDSYISYLGLVAGSFASIGVSIANFIFGSIDKYLDQNKNFIKDKLVELFNVLTRYNEIRGKFILLIRDIFSIFNTDEAKQVGANLIEGIANGFISGFVLLQRFSVDILSCIINPLVENKALIIKTIKGMLSPIEQITKTIAKGISDTFKTIDDVYKQYLEPSFIKIKEGISAILSTILENYNKFIKPVVDMIAVEFGTLWQIYIQPAINSMAEFFGKLFELVSILWQNVLSPLIEWLVSTLAPIWAAVFENAWNVIKTVFAFISDVIKGAMEFFSGLCEFLSGVFTLDWDKAWNGIKTMFTGVWDTMKAWVTGAIDIISTVINNTLNSISSIWSGIWNGISSVFGDIWDGICDGVDSAINEVKDTIGNVLGTIEGIWKDMWSGLEDFVSGTWDNIMKLWNSGGEIFTNISDGFKTIFTNIVNGMIGGINKVIKTPLKVVSNALKTIHDIDLPLIGKPFTIVPRGFDIPQIPKLAQGGFAKRNQPQLAMIGDNTRYGEIVAPENKMLDMVNTALKMQKEQSSIVGLDDVINLIKQLISVVQSLCLKVDIDVKKLSILLEQAQRERQMIGG